MMKLIVGINELIDINKQIEEQGLPYRISLHDGCGWQNFTIKVTKPNPTEDTFQRFDLLLTESLKEANRGVDFTITYSDDKSQFWIQ